jgi:hypothetical protein
MVESFPPLQLKTVGIIVGSKIFENRNEQAFMPKKSPL